MSTLRNSMRDTLYATRGTLCEQWERMQQWNPIQRRMLAVIALLLVVNIVLVINLSASPAQISEENNKFRRSFDQANEIDESSGAIYIRWGRTECPDEAELVYEGVAGGGHYTHEGSGANYVCLPLDPAYEHQDVISNGAIMYGTEYEELNFVSGKVIHDHNVPCAMCQSLGRRNVVMLPARNACYPGWHLEYNGYLVADHHTHKSSKMFECLDHHPEADQAGYRNENGALMYHVKGECGSLPCPPYEEGKTLTCAVCTK